MSVPQRAPQVAQRRVAQRSRWAVAFAFAMGALVAMGWNMIPASPMAAGGEPLLAANALAGAALGANAANTAAAPAQSAAAAARGYGLPAFSDLIERVKPAVVTIIVERTVPVAGRGGNDALRGTAPGAGDMEDFFDRFFGPNGPAGQGGRRYGPTPHAGGQGSGFIIDDRGYIVTNNHVVNGFDSVKVVLDDGSEMTAKVVGADAATDLALIKVDTNKKLRSVEFGDSDKARVGDWIVAIGNPFGFGGTATVGVISARGRDLRAGPYDDFLQIDAAINSGNSGGPVFDATGRVIGVNTAIYSPNGGSVGLGFAIPAAQVRTVIADLRNGGKVKRGWLGVQIQDVTPELARSLGLAAPEGALVADVVAGSPAQKAGVRPGDVVRRYGDAAIKNAKDLSRHVATTGKGDDVSLEVWRDGKPVRVAVGIGTQAAAIASAGDTPAAGNRVDARASDLGIELGVLDAATREQLGIPAGVDGVLVRDVHNDSKAAEQGIRPGDVISMVNQQAVRTPKALTDAVAAARKNKRDAVSLLVQRGDTRQFVAIDLASR